VAKDISRQEHSTFADRPTESKLKQINQAESHDHDSAEALQACVQEITAILYKNTDAYLEEDAKGSVLVWAYSLSEIGFAPGVTLLLDQYTLHSRGSPG